MNAHGSLLMHTPGSHRVSLDTLRSFPDPVALGPRHKPIPHHVLVDELQDQVTGRGWMVRKRDLGVARKGHALFGVMDLLGPETNDDTGTTLGFRSSTNSAFAIRGVAGARVFVCDNLCFSGDEFVMRHKLTTLLNLPALVSGALDKFTLQNVRLQDDISTLRQLSLSDTRAKVRIFEAFDAGTLPLHLFDDVSRHYFRPTDAEPDCQPRTAWGLHNAFTRSIKHLRPQAQFNATLNLGRQFNLATITHPEEA